MHISSYFTFIFKISPFFFGYFGNFYYFCSTVSYLLYDMTANSPIQKHFVEGKHKKALLRLVFDLWNLGHSKSHVKEPCNDDAYGYVYMYLP